MANNIKIEVGEEVCIVSRGFTSGRSKEYDDYARRRNGVITKVGRKFFYVTPEGSNWELKFYIEGMREDRGGYCIDNYLYKTFEDYKEEVDNRRATDKLKTDYFSTFTSTKLTVDQCERIIKIIEEK